MSSSDGRGGESSKEEEEKPLANAEVAILLKTHCLKTQRKPKEHIKQALDYCKAFSIPDVLHPDKAQFIADMRSGLEAETAEVEGRDEKLTPKEVVKIMNLRPKEADDAYELIPTLNRFKKKDVDNMLRHLDEK